MLKVSKETRKEFYKYLTPSVIGCVSISLLILIDGIFIGRGIGGYGLAALSTSVPAFALYSALGVLLGMGGATIASIQAGQGNHHSKNTTFTISMIMAITIGIVATALQQGFLDGLISMLGAKGSLFLHVKDYLGVLSLFTSLYVGAQFLNSFIRNDNNPKLAMMAMMASGATNIIGDYLFIFRFEWGLKGAAFATGLSQVSFVAVLLFHFISDKNSLRLNFKGLKFSIVQRILKTGFPSFLSDISNCVVIFIFNLTLFKVAGEVAVSAYGIILNFNYVIFLTYIGISQASQPLISMNYGKKDMTKVKETITLALIISITFSILVYIAISIFKTNIVLTYNNEPDIVKVASNAMPIFFSATLFMGINVILASFFQAIEYSLVSSFIVFSRGLIFVTLGLIILPSFLGINGVWYATLFGETITLFGFLIYRYFFKIKL